MRIIIDFDNTVFNTTRQIKLTHKLITLHGVSVRDWQQAWPAMAGTKHFGKGVYSIEEHLKRFGKRGKFDARKFLADYRRLHKNEYYLFPDTIDFLKFAREKGQVHLVTYGHRRFQSWKIKLSKIGPLFHRVKIVSDPKSRRIKRILAKNDVNVFLDDNADEIDEVKKYHPEVVCIHVRRPKTMHVGQTSKSKDFEVKSLREAKKIIEQLQRRFTGDVSKAVKALKHGQAVVYPTDTAYGLGVDATNVAAVKKMYEIKERGFKQPVHVIVSNLAMARKYVRFNKLAEKIFKKFMPGALTIVLELRDETSPSVPLLMRRGKGRSWKILSGGTGMIGVRIPDNRVALNLVKKLGRPITTSSANPSAHKSGGWTPYSAIDSFKQFYGRKYQPDLYLDAGILPKRKTSTIVKVAGNKIKVLRKGPINV